MAKYIQGSTVFTYLRADALKVAFQGTTEDDQYGFYFSGNPMAGDLVVLHFQDESGNVFDAVYECIDEDRGTLIDGITALIDAVAEFSTTAYGPDGYGLNVATTAHTQVTGSVTVQLVYKTIACTKSDVLNLENELIEITQTQRKNTEFLPTFQGLSISIEQSVVADVNTGQLATSTIEDWALNQTLLSFLYERPDGSSGYRRVIGECYIKNFSESGGVNTGALVTYEMQVTGGITVI